MSYSEISKSFDSLIESMKKLLPGLNQQGSELIEKHQYQEAKEIILKAETIVSLQNNLKTMKEKWLDLDLLTDDIALSSEDEKQKLSSETLRGIRSHLPTSSQEFRIPILRALVNLSGSA